jgi:hypothetical protein
MTDVKLYSRANFYMSVTSRTHHLSGTASEPSVYYICRIVVTWWCYSYSDCEWKIYNRGNLCVTQSHKGELEGRLDNCVIS